MSGNAPHNDVARARNASQLLAEISTDDASLNRLKHELSQDAANLAAEIAENADMGSDDAPHSTEEI